MKAWSKMYLSLGQLRVGVYRRLSVLFEVSFWITLLVRERERLVLMVSLEMRFLCSCLLTLLSRIVSLAPVWMGETMVVRDFEALLSDRADFFLRLRPNLIAALSNPIADSC